MASTYTVEPTNVTDDPVAIEHAARRISKILNDGSPTHNIPAIPFAFVGGYACLVLGSERATGDVDLCFNAGMLSVGRVLRLHNE
jgi:hypothetical protein